MEALLAVPVGEFSRLPLCKHVRACGIGSGSPNAIFHGTP